MMPRFEVQGNDLVIRIALNVNPPASKSGKTRIISTTSGFTGYTTPFGQVSIGLNVTTKDEDYRKGSGNNVAQGGAAAPKLVA